MGVIGTLIIVPVGQSGVHQNELGLVEAALHILGQFRLTGHHIIEVPADLILFPLDGPSVEIVAETLILRAIAPIRIR